MQEPQERRLEQELRKARIWSIISVVVTLTSMVTQVYLYFAFVLNHVA